jgi:hypothetical protein
MKGRQWCDCREDEEEELKEEEGVEEEEEKQPAGVSSWRVRRQHAKKGLPINGAILQKLTAIAQNGPLLADLPPEKLTSSATATTTTRSTVTCVKRTSTTRATIPLEQ